MANKTIPVTNHSPGRRAWESPAPPTKMLFVCFGWIWRRRSDLLFSCGYHSRCIITYWKKKSDWIVKPWEHVDQNIQISEVVKSVRTQDDKQQARRVFFMRDEKDSHRSLENWKFDPRPKSDVFSLFMHDSWFSCRHSFVATFAATFSTERVICSELQSKSRRPFLPQIWRWCPSSLAFSC